MITVQIQEMHRIRVSELRSFEEHFTIISQVCVSFHREIGLTCLFIWAYGYCATAKSVAGIETPHNINAHNRAKRFFCVLARLS